MDKNKNRDVVASLLDLPEFAPERTMVHLPRLKLDIELQEIPYDKLIRIRREQDPQIHLLLASITNHPELKDAAWYRDKKGCPTPVDALKKVLRAGEVEKLCRVIDRLNGYAAGSVMALSADDLERLALNQAVEELEKN